MGPLLLQQRFCTDMSGGDCSPPRRYLDENMRSLRQLGKRRSTGGLF